MRNIPNTTYIGLVDLNQYQRYKTEMISAQDNEDGLKIDGQVFDDEEEDEKERKKIE